ncbi:MAG: CNNM domain-containing protein, partial [Pseudanabaena sp.]
TVQIGITLIGILSGALGGATVAQTLQQSFDAVPLLQPYSKTLSFAIVVGIITYLSLVVGELVPKRLAMSNAEQIACAVAPPMRFLANIGTPVVYLLSISTEALLIILLILVNGVFSMSELAIVSARKVRLEQWAKEGNTKARAALRLIA